MRRSRKNSRTADTERTLAGGGEMGALMRELDWSSTAIGPVEGWPQSLRTAVGICLASRFPILIWWGPRLVKLYNDAYRAILGAKHPRALGSPGQEVWPEIWDIIGPMLEGVMRRGEATWSDDQLLALERNGFPEECYFTFSYSPIRDETGGVGGVFTAVTETTERVLAERRTATLRALASRMAGATSAEEACAQASAELAHAAHDVPFALIYLVDSGGTRASLAGATGLDARASVTPASVRLSGDVDAEDAWGLATALRAQRPVEVSKLDERFGRLPGGPWPEAPSAALVLPLAGAGTGQGSAAGLLVVGISPRLRLDGAYRSFLELVAGQIAAGVAGASAFEETHRRAEMLAELDRAKTAFFSNVSHEFRTPLTLMLGPLEDLIERSGRQSSAEDREQLEVAHRNGLRMLKLVNSLLDFARIEAGRIQASYEPVDLAVATAELASVFRSAIERAGLRLVVDCPPLPEPAFVDRDMWEKLVLNLISNALKHTFHGVIAIRLYKDGGDAVLEVRDTGTGIPEQELPRVFERFHRVRGSRARTQEGSGIGLALVQEIARLHGGTVRVSSEEGVGSTFTVTVKLGVAHLPADRLGRVPAAASTALGAAPFVEEALRWLPEEPPWSSAIGTTAPSLGAAAVDGHDEPSRVRPARILVADDNADMRDYVRRLLSRSYVVELAADGAAALESVRERPPDLLLADVMMPRLDGFGLLREVRADPRTRNIPVVLLSARAGEESRVEGLEAGADDYLVKPFGVRELLARVQAHLALARVRAESARALRESEERLRSVVAVLPAAVVIVDAAGSVVLANRAAAEITGEDVTGMAIPLDDTGVMLRTGSRRMDGTPYRARELPLQRALLNGARVYGEQLLLKHAATGEDVPVLANSAPLCDPEGRVTGAVIVFQDITAIRDLDLRKDEFLAAVSHDLKNPLAGIQGQAQLLRARSARPAGLDASRLQEGLREIERVTSRMTDMVDELLDLTRLQMGRPVELRREEGDLVAITGRVVAALQATTASHPLRVESEERALPGRWDTSRLERVLENLLENAIKYSPNGGAITVRTHRELREGVPCAVLVVRDQGLGIPADELPRIFDRFHRARNVRGRVMGTGLGLTGVRHIVERHGGTIEVESAEGQGSTFTVRLPLESG